MSSHSNTKIRVLFIDDSEYDNDYVRLLLEIENVQVDSIFETNGQAGLTYLLNVSPETFPEIIFVDINMPLIDGFDFVRLYTKDFYPRYPNTKIFMMSSTKRLSEIERARRLPIVSDFIEKPLVKIHFEHPDFFSRTVSTK